MELILMAVSAVIVIALMVGFFAGLLWVVRGVRGGAEGSLQAAMGRFEFAQEETPGFLKIRYPTYVGVIATVTEQDWHLWVRDDQAEQLLNSMFLFNMKRGLFCPHAPLIFILFSLNYFQQKRSIRAQQKKRSPL